MNGKGRCKILALKSNCLSRSRHLPAGPGVPNIYTSQSNPGNTGQCAFWCAFLAAGIWLLPSGWLPSLCPPRPRRPLAQAPCPGCPLTPATFIGACHLRPPLMAAEPQPPQLTVIATEARMVLLLRVWNSQSAESHRLLLLPLAAKPDLDQLALFTLCILPSMYIHAFLCRNINMLD